MKKTKRIKRIINAVIWTLIGSYLLLMISLQIPAVQHFIGNRVENTLSKKLGTNVSVGKVSLGFLNRLVIDDVVIKDQQNKDMLNASRLSAKLDVIELLSGNIDISSAQIFGLDANLYKKNAKSPYNFQFLLDSLKSKDPNTDKNLNLSINSLVIRHGRIRYHQHDIPKGTGTFNLNHLDLKNLSAHVMVDRLTDDSLSLKVKRLSFVESSGLDIKNIVFKLTATNETAKLQNLTVSLPKSHIHIPEFNVEELSKQKVFHGKINESVIAADDVKPFVSHFTESKNLPSSITLTATFNGDQSHVNMERLSITSTDDAFNFTGNGHVAFSKGITNYYANIHQLSFDTKMLKGLNIPEIPQIASLGKVDYRGKIGGDQEGVFVDGELQTDVGQLNADVNLHGNALKGHIVTEGIDLHKLLNDNRFGMLATKMDVEGNIKDQHFKVKGKVGQLDFEGNTYKDIDIDGTYQKKTFAGKLAINDENGHAQIDGTIDLSSNIPNAHLTANVHNFNSSFLPLNEKWKHSRVSFDTQIDMKGKSLNQLNGNIDLQNFKLTSAEDNYELQSLNVKSTPMGNKQQIDIDADFGTIEISGNYDYKTLVQSITNTIKDRLPTLPGLTKSKNIRPNDFTLQANITKSDWLKSLFNIDMELNQPMTIHAAIDDEKKAMDINCILPDFIYKENQYKDSEIFLKTIGDTLKMNGTVKKKMNNGNFFDLAVTAEAADNKTKADIMIDNHDELQHLNGIISTETQFFYNEEGKPTAHAIIHPSQISVNETTWYVEPSDIVYSDKRLVIDHFAIMNGDQHIIISGIATNDAKDSVNVDLQNVEVGLFSDILNVDDVAFGGSASGKATIASVFSNTTAKAMLTIDDFTFVNGRLGTLYANAQWNKTDDIINIQGTAKDGPLAQTLINGHVALSPGYLDLGCELQNTRIEFLENYLNSVMHEIEARANGDIHIFGPLKDINIEGDVVANGDIALKPLNTTYTLKNCNIQLLPNHLLFRNDTVFDKNNHLAVVNGDIYHDCLKKWIYDIHVDADNVLAFDMKDFGEDLFCGTIYASGTCHISNQTNEVVIDIDATPQENSIIKYNADSPNTVKKQEFIHWNDVTASQLVNSSDSSSLGISSPFGGGIERGSSSEIPTNLRINFRINTTPDLTLKLIMNEESGDYIDLHGEGILRASYFNKGDFQIFGNYTVTSGVYKMTIQNIIKKDFEFQEGGIIVFSGEPYEATLNLKARHTVNGVSLSDLSIGRSFASNNIRVNCLMNITGTPNAPKAEFDFELPTVSGDAQQMVRSLINSEEELNQQVIYLLTIGRFYTQGTNNANQDATSPSQTSLAMQSLLSGTLSQQINTVLSSVLKSNNWNFGANISTGAEGWNNAEYEGILSGRLLNNRLLINGQFGYRDNPNATTSFIGDFDIRYLLFPNGNLALKVYNQTNDRYFTRNSLNTQGIGLIIKKDFDSFRELFGRKKQRSLTERESKKKAQKDTDSISVTTPTDSVKQK